MRIYTKTGDRGQTGLFGGARVRKDDARVETFGAVDELNAAIGWARASGERPEIDRVLADVQVQLFELGAALAGGPDANSHVAELEAAIDQFDAQLPPLRRFILPGGSPAAAALHLARTVCRRAERRAVTLGAKEAVVYLNRLSDLLFVLARAANRSAGVPDVEWKP